MTEHFSSAPSSPHIPRILIAENNFDIFESLVNTIKGGQLHCDFDLCTSRDHALRKLIGPPYHLIISGVHLAEMDDFFLLKQTKDLHTQAPFVVTAGTSDKESARHALSKGAFHLIRHPLDPEETASTIRLALWHNKLIALLASQEKAVEKYHQHMAAYPADKKMEERFNKVLSYVQKTVLVAEESMHRIEISNACFADVAQMVEKQVLEQAFQRLSVLSASPL